MSIIQPHHTLVINDGSSELAVTNRGSGEVKYEIAQGDEHPASQKLSGPGSMQEYENVVYPVKIHNFGPDSIEVT